MTTPRIPARIENLFETEQDWLIGDPVLLRGEFAVVKFGSTEKIKIGNGIDKFSQRPYMILETGNLKDAINPTTPPVTPSQPVSFIAETGIYPNFGGVEVTGAAGYIVWNGDEWKAVNLSIDLVEYAKKTQVDHVVANVAGINETNKQDSENPFEWSDAQGHLTGKVTSEGIWELFKILSNNYSVGGKQIISADQNNDYLFSQEDALGNIAWAISKNRQLLNLKISEIDVIKTKPLGMAATINHVIIYGQSLSIGAFGTPVLSVNQKYANLMFKGGVHLDFYTNPSDAFMWFQPLIESPYQGGTQGETVASGMTEMAIQAIYEETGQYYNNDYVFLATCTGESNQSIDFLSKFPSDPAYQFNYQKNITAVTQGYRLAHEAGKSYNVPAMVFIHGEADLSNGQDYYLDKLRKLKIDFCNDVKRITGQSNDPIILLTQVASHRFVDVYPNIAIAQLRASLEIEGVYLAETSYQTAYYSDNIHKVADSYKKMGAMIGYCLKRNIIDQTDYNALHIEKYSFQKNIIELQYNIVNLQTGLVIDTTIVSNPGDYGFSLSDASGTPISILSIVVTRLNTVTIKCASGIVIGKGWKLTYGNPSSETGSGPTTGGRGNIRDAQGITKIYTGSTSVANNDFVYPIHRWAAIQEIKF